MGSRTRSVTLTPPSTVLLPVAVTFGRKPELPSRGLLPEALTAEDIEWTYANAGHRRVLEAFICAEPEHPEWDPRGRVQLPHPAPWELTVQSEIRTTHPPLPESEALLLGFSAGRLAAVCNYGWITDRGEHPQLFISVLARDVTFRGRRVGDVTLQTVLSLLRSEKQRANVDCGVFARIDGRNTKSRALFSKNGFVCLEDYREPDTRLDYWVHGLP